MAGYREHITVSGLCGACYGTGSVLLLGFSPVDGALAAMLSWLSGMLPDLDSDSGRPVQEVFGLLAAAVPLVMIRRLLHWAGTADGAVLAAAILYVAIRYGVAHLLKRITVHRGMFHSIPALLIAAEIAFLTFTSDHVSVRLLMAGGVALGFFTHLALDELYSVQWNGARIRLKDSAGTALKMVGKEFVPNVVTYSLLMLLTYAIFADLGLVELPGPADTPQPSWQQAAELPERY